MTTRSTRSTKSTRSRGDAANKKLAKEIHYRNDKITWLVIQGENNISKANYVLTVCYQYMTIDFLYSTGYRFLPKNWIAT